MRFINVLTSIFALILLVGCASGEKTYVPEKYSPKSEMPIIFEDSEDAHFRDYANFGYFTVKIKVPGLEGGLKSEDKTAALKKAALYGADAITIRRTTIIVSKGGSIPVYGQNYTGIGPSRIIVGKEFVGPVQKPGIQVDLYRYDPSKAYIQGFNRCFFGSPNCRSETVKKLLSKGADPNARNNEGYTLMYRLLDNLGTGYSLPGSETCLTVQILLDAGADPNIVPKKSRSLIKLIRDKPRDVFARQLRMSDADWKCLDKLEKLLLSKGVKP
jgi:hypothetical protein